MRPDLAWRLAPGVFVLLWAAGYSFARLGLAHAEPMTLLALRYGLAVPLLLPLVLWRRPALPRGWRHWGAVALTGAMIQVVYFGLAWMAMKQGLSAGTTAIIMALQPILVALAGQGRAGWLRPALPAGLICGFAGVALAVAGGDALAPAPPAALALAGLALAGLTLATLFEGRHGFRTDPGLAGVVHYGIGVVVLAPLAALTETMTISWSPGFAIALAYLVIGNSLVSVGLYLALLQRGDATRISALLFLVPPLAAVLGWLILREPIAPLAWPGFGLAALGVWLVHRAARPPAAVDAPRPKA